MPELPEVETTCRGIRAALVDQSVQALEIRRGDLRQPMSAELPQAVQGQTCLEVGRRAKYLWLRFRTGHVLGHLGMSGSLRLLPTDAPWRKHDHWQMSLSTGEALRYHDPRRFGLWLWTAQPLAEHPLIKKLGPEPLGQAFTADYLFRSTRRRRRSLKEHVMDPQVVVGVGNIYAAESLFLAGKRPGIAAQRLTRADSEAMVRAIRQVLTEAIERGGTTLQDFSGARGEPGYFAQELQVYGRAGAPCRRCGSLIRRQVHGQRSSFYCPRCQS